MNGVDFRFKCHALRNKTKRECFHSQSVSSTPIVLQMTRRVRSDTHHDIGVIIGNFM